jgi:hypothetical protein
MLMADLYRVETTQNESGFYALAQVQAGLYEAEHNRKLTVFGLLFIAAGGVFYALLKQSAIAVLPVIIGCWLLIWKRTRLKTRAKQMAESLKGRDPLVVYRFDPDGIHIKNAEQQGKASYDSIVNIAENDEYFFLFINESTAHLLRKTDFTLGDAETFAAFIEGRTGLRMNYQQRKKMTLF